VKRGELWIGSGPTDFTGKPRPMLIVQSDLLESSNSVIVCPLTSTDSGAPRFRIPIRPGSASGLNVQSWVMVDKPSTILRSKLSIRIGACPRDVLQRLDAELMIVLGLV
jgi:mRNA interferase MazF